MKFKIKFPHSPGAGGPGSFQTRFENELRRHGHLVCYKGDKIVPHVIFVVGGTKSLFWLILMRLKGIPVLYRLDGISWLHKKRKTSFKYYFIAEVRNILSKLIHGFIASKIVYQSQFVKDWWDKSGWRKRKSFAIIYNGVENLNRNDLFDDKQELENQRRLVILEGVIDYTPYAVKLLNELAEKLPKDIIIELYGKFEHHSVKEALNPRLSYKGVIKRENVFNVLKDSVYLSLDIHPACPNTVIEALSCATPIVAFKTGAIPELIDIGCGKVVNYGSDPWQLSYPNSHALIEGIIQVFSNYKYFSKNSYLKFLKDYQINDIFSNYENIFREFYNVKP